jgi:hypothetical protein
MDFLEIIALYADAIIRTFIYFMNTYSFYETLFLSQ